MYSKVEMLNRLNFFENLYLYILIKFRKYIKILNCIIENVSKVTLTIYKKFYK